MVKLHRFLVLLFIRRIIIKKSPKTIIQYSSPRTFFIFLFIDWPWKIYWNWFEGEMDGHSKSVVNLISMSAVIFSIYFKYINGFILRHFGRIINCFVNVNLFYYLNLLIHLFCKNTNSLVFHGIYDCHHKMETWKRNWIHQKIIEIIKATTNSLSNVLGNEIKSA